MLLWGPGCRGLEQWGILVFLDQCIRSGVQPVLASPVCMIPGQGVLLAEPRAPLMSVVFVFQARSKLSQLQESRLEAHRSLEQYDQVPDGVSGTSLPDLATLSEGILLAERGGFGAMVKVE